MMTVIQEVIKFGTKTIDHVLTLLSLTVITLFHQRNYRKLVWRCCDELVMNQFEVKEKLNNFFINNFIAQRNNFKIKIKLKVKKKKRKKFCRVADFTFCEINNISPGFYLVLP